MRTLARMKFDFQKFYQAVDAKRRARAASWRQVARDAFAWFFGDNDAGVPLATVDDGGCFDGLMATGINRNQGAESILSLHLAALTMRHAFGKLKRTGQDGDIAPEAGSFALSNKVHDPIPASSATA